MSFQVQTFENIPVAQTTYVYQSGGSFGGNSVVGGGEGVTTTTYTYTTESSSNVVGGSSNSGNLLLGSAGGAGSVTLSSSSGNLGGGVVFVSDGGSSNALASGSALQAASNSVGNSLSLGVAGGAGSLGGNNTVTVISSQSGSGVGGASVVDVVSLGGGVVGSSSGSSLGNGVVRSLSGASLGGGGGVVVGSASGGSLGGGGGVVVGSASGASLDASFISQIEQTIVRATNPVDIQETETITVNGQTGIWANKQEVLNWRGVIPITQYVINQDSNPEIITKRTGQVLTYEQEVAIRYLRPPTPPLPGEIIIRQERNLPTAPAPPLVIRQQPPRPETPAPLVIREAPPRPPGAIGQKVITISGKRLPPAPRKVVIERLAPIPAKPQSYIIERWLPYNSAKRRVILQKSTEADPIVQKPRNVIVQWETPEVRIRKEFKDLGVIRANPVEYVQRYGATLKQHVELPQFVREIRPPTGVVLAAEYNAPSLFELEGDVQALNLIDLDREGLSEYRLWLSKFLAGGSGVTTTTVTTVTSGNGGAVVFGALPGAGGAGTLAGALGGAVGFDALPGAGGAGTLAGALGGAAASAGAAGAVSGGSSVTFVSSSSNISVVDLLNTLTVELFGNLDANRDYRVTIADAENLVIRFHNSLGRSYTKDDAEAFFKKYDINREGPKLKKLKKVLLNEFSIRA